MHFWEGKSRCSDTGLHFRLKWWKNKVNFMRCLHRQCLIKICSNTKSDARSSTSSVSFRSIALLRNECNFLCLWRVFNFRFETRYFRLNAYEANFPLVVWKNESVDESSVMYIPFEDSRPCLEWRQFISQKAKRGAFNCITVTARPKIRRGPWSNDF